MMGDFFWPARQVSWKVARCSGVKNQGNGFLNDRWPLQQKRLGTGSHPTLTLPAIREATVLDQQSSFEWLNKREERSNTHSGSIVHF